MIFGQWQNQAGAFSQTFTATGGCDSTHTVVMETNPLPDAVLEWSPPVCPGESNGSIVDVTATTGLEYSLNGSDFQGVGEFYQLAAGDYILRIRDSLGCRAEKTLTLPTPPLLFLELPGDTLVQPGQPVQLSPLTGGGNLSYAWSPAQYLDCFDCAHPVATPLASITYTLTIQNAQGCSVSDSIRIRVEKEDPGVFISNAMRPGSSNGNDLFTVFALQGVREVVSMEIYDRWGGLMFRREHFAADGTVGWDGTARGKAVLPGVYVYLLEVELGDGTRKKMKGDVTVLR
ncbi:MAG: gliding motility-associated C-terminal domain-containing protein [Haliscomenobacteraceae bacterium CHB4]|nr:gliding motility-associated C-terminal domain-containing protein [Haliscomenobacteraceae bacterium CHB4]